MPYKLDLFLPEDTKPNIIVWNDTVIFFVDPECGAVSEKGFDETVVGLTADDITVTNRSKPSAPEYP